MRQLSLVTGQNAKQLVIGRVGNQARKRHGKAQQLVKDA